MAIVSGVSFYCVGTKGYICTKLTSRNNKGVTVRINRLLFMCILSVLTLAAIANDKDIRPGELYQKSTEAIYKDIERNLGIVPMFLRKTPAIQLEGAWDEFKALQIGATNIPGKYRDLIALGVSAQIPCHYCILFHTEMAKLGGATEMEISEALSSAALTRKWSAYLYGTQVDMAKFKKDIDRVVSNAKINMKKDPETLQKPIMVTDPSTVYIDALNRLGFVPDFIRSYPKSAVVGAWKSFTAAEMGPSAIPRRYRSLVNLAVAAQTPCQYCTYADTQFAKLNGATAEQIHESVLLAAQVRTWSTMLNGMQMNMDEFRDEVETIVSHFKKKMELSE